MALTTPLNGGFLATRAKSLFVASKSKEDRDNPEKFATFYARVLLTHEALKDPKWLEIMKAIHEAGAEKFGKNFKTMFAEGGIRSPVRKEIASKGYDADVFGAFIGLKAYEDNPPAILNRDGSRMTDQALMYPGAKVRASVKIRPYEFKLQGGGFSRGISIDLLGMQKVGDAPRMTTAGGDGAEGLDALPEEGDDDFLAGLGGLS